MANPRFDKREAMRGEYPVDKRIREACEKAVIAAIKETMTDNPSRLVRTLERHEIGWIVGECLAAYTNARAHECALEAKRGGGGLFEDDVTDLY